LAFLTSLSDGIVPSDGPIFDAQIFVFEKNEHDSDLSKKCKPKCRVKFMTLENRY